MAYTFDQIFAADPSNPERVASNGVVTIFAPGDESRTPLQITTVDGMVIQNPVQVNDSGHGPAFMHETLDRVAWEGGGFSGFLTSYEGMKEEAVAARLSAQASAVDAAEAAANSSAPTAEAIEYAITTEGVARAAVVAVAKDAAASKLEKTEAASTFAAKPDNGGRAVGKGELMVNVRDFGAMGDGVASDSPGIQAAIDWLDANGGGDLLVPRGADYGDYWVRETVKLCSNIRIVGSGNPVLRKKVGDPTYAIFAGLSNGRRGYGSGASNIEVFGVEFRGTFGTATTPERSACAFALHHAENVLVRNCNFIEMQITGHVFDLNGCRNITIRDNVFRGIMPSTGPGVAECIQLDQSKNGSLSFADAPGSYDGLLTCDVLIANNKFLPYVAADGTWYPAPNIGGNHTVRQGAYYENIKIVDNYVEDPIRGTGDRWVGNVHLMGTRNVEILRNTWVSTRGELAKLVSIMSVDVGNDLKSDPEVASPVSAIPAQGCVDVRIEGNTIRGFSGTANSAEYLIHIWGIENKGDVMSGISVADNTFRDNYATGGTDPIRVQDASSVTLSRNKFIGSNYRAVSATRVTDLKVDDNNVNGPTYIQMFWIDACAVVSFTRNQWKGARAVSRIKSSSDVTISGNTGTNPATSQFGLVLEDVARFNAHGNTFTTAIANASAIVLTGTTNSQGRIGGNACFGYAAASAGAGTNVTISENYI